MLWLHEGRCDEMNRSNLWGTSTMVRVESCDYNPVSRKELPCSKGVRARRGNGLRKASVSHWQVGIVRGRELCSSRASRFVSLGSSLVFPGCSGGSVCGRHACAKRWVMSASVVCVAFSGCGFEVSTRCVWCLPECRLIIPFI